MYTLEDLMAIARDERAELINGTIHMMAPSVAKHSLAGIRLSAKLDKYFEDKKEKNPKDADIWVILPEAWTDYGKHNSFVHDIAGFSLKEHKRVVLEYHRVPFYWLVDPARKTIQVFELESGSKHYQIIKSVEDKDGIVILPPFTDLEIDLRRIFNY